jgi:hypothetical protein
VYVSFGIETMADEGGNMKRCMRVIVNDVAWGF